MRKFIVTLIALSALVKSALATDFVLIVSSQAPVKVFDAQDVRNIYLGNKIFQQDGSVVLVFMQKSSPLTNTFCMQALGMSEQQYYLYWRKRIFTGQGVPPMEVNDDANMKRLVATRPGSIGYISIEALDSTVKALEVR